jgi:Bacterial membrane protein YfhO
VTSRAETPHGERDGLRADIIARACLTFAALLPYWRLLTFGVVYATDDVFTSDIFNGELPGRALIGTIMRHGQLPVWTNQLCSGLPLAGSSADPIGLAAFSLLPPAPALDVFVIVLLLVAAHGAYGLARRFGADRPGAVLTGIAFAGSGYIACQLKHLAIVSTVVWLPVGLALLDRTLAAGDDASPRSVSPARRALLMAAFGLVFAEQALCGFPQSIYYCALVYGSFALFRAIANRQRLGDGTAWLRLLGGLGIATALGAVASAVVLLPLSELGSVSDRAEALGWAWSTSHAYWPPNVLTFLVPYIHGDISTNTYTGHSLFWEDYGYVGAATFVLAVYGGVRERRRPLVLFAIVMTLVAYLMVLGPATMAFDVAYWSIPGMKMFRFPTRFLIIVELGLALLGGVGLTRLGADLRQRWTGSPRIPQLIVLAVCVGTMFDLFLNQPRQNATVSASEWLAPPRSVDVVRAGSPQPRTLTPGHADLHSQAFVMARGWANVEPYFQLRDLLQPNTGGGFWNTPSADCYAGIAPRWYVDVWGDHNRDGLLVTRLSRINFAAGTLRVHPALPKILRAYGVSHVISAFPQELITAFPQQGPPLALAGREGNAYIYRVEGAARARFVRTARRVDTDEEAGKILLDVRFNPDEGILLHDAPDTVRPLAGALGAGAASPAPARAVVTREDSRELVIDADAPEDGFLLLADTYYPGWRVQVDGTPTPLYRANISVRGIPIAKGRHEVRFTYDAPGFVRGLQVTLLAIAALLVWAAVAAYLGSRVRW